MFASHARIFCGDERQASYVDREPLVADLGEDPGSGCRKLGWQVAHGDRRLDAWPEDTGSDRAHWELRILVGVQQRTRPHRHAAGGSESDASAIRAAAQLLQNNRRARKAAFP